MIRKSTDGDIMNQMIKIIFSDDIYEVDEQQIKEFQKTFDLERDTAKVL